MKSFDEKEQELKKVFQNASSPDEKYRKVMELGKTLAEMPEEQKKAEYIVPGCQSIVYLHATLDKEKIYFTASSEALISSGLAAILFSVYNGESPETILKRPPSFLEEIGIAQALTPGRSNGLASMYQTMQKWAVKFLIVSPKNP